MSALTELDLTVEEHDKAFTEVSFLLEIFIETMEALSGSGAPSVGMSAGRQMGKKLPIYLHEPKLDEAIAAVNKKLESGFDVELNCTDLNAELKVGRCAIRDVCKRRGQEVGGELCKMFHYYHAGIVSEVYGKPVRPRIVDAAETCSFEMKARS